MRELSLFTGTGGGILGSKLLGWKTVGYVEFNDYCQRVIKQRIADGIFDNAPIFGDIRAFISEGYAARYRGLVDTITGGFPCQPFSVAGKQLAENDERNMWPETAECVRIIRPRIVYFENVTGLLSTGYFEQILCDLYEMGYNVRWCTLSASETGAPHKRERVWILAHSECWGRERPDKGIRSEGKAPIKKELVNLRCVLANTTKSGLEGKITASGEWKHDGLSTECSWWSVEPGMGRVVNGLANRMHRLKAIGNGQVPITMAAAFQALSQGII